MPRKNKSCKECGNINPKGRSFCSDKCAHTNLLKRRAVKRWEDIAKKNRIKESIHNEIVEYYKLLVNEVSSLDELYKLDLDRKKYKKARHWILRYCGRPEWMLSAEAHMDKVQKEKAERNKQKLIEVNKLLYIKKVITEYYDTENTLKMECECTNGHILKKTATDLLKQTKCPTCELIELRNEKKINKELELETSGIQREQSKLNKNLKRVKLVSDFIDSGEYKNYDSWTVTPITKEYHWLRNGFGKEYLTQELKLQIDAIGYFEYKSSTARPPIEPKENHFWCRHCREEKKYDEARGVTDSGNPTSICTACSKSYRKENYGELERKKAKEKYYSNDVYRIGCVIRTHIYNILRGKFNKIKDKSWEEIVGLSKKEFFKYVESQLESGWNMDNYGTEWVIQHIVPRDFAEVEEDAYLLNYYKNLMPWGFSDNASLKNKVEASQLNEWHHTNERIKYLLKNRL
jgi:hypothetical protein